MPPKYIKIKRPGYAKNEKPECTDVDKKKFIDALLANDISCEDLGKLGKCIDAEDLSYIIQHIYDLNEDAIYNISALDGALKFFDALKNGRRNDDFIRKIKAGFRDKEKHPNNLVILAEGDSWFNYPILLTDIIDRISMDKTLAVYSIAQGGDWLLNMLKGMEYVEELSVLHPDVFLISAGGNDLVGSNRLAAIVEPLGNGEEHKKCGWAVSLIEKAEKKLVPLDEKVFDIGIKYLSKDFYALLMFFYLQYSFLINGIACGGKTGKSKFTGIKIITQGYDYPRPSYNKGFGINPLRWYKPFVRLFLGHGGWLKRPLQMRGIYNTDIQNAILYSMIYLFNEAMIDVGRAFNNGGEKKVFHIDSRGSVGNNGWTDELHALPEHFIKTGEVFVSCIKQTAPPSYDAVYVVNKK